ncbi:hypothetical protein K7T73_13135 [Bacillus badius]|uniref:hypothetical protein n=1 Tax=Bacillus badius TaxID=1455 RepID=UPI001CBFA798|nr:hypothetical protein [Bacillus badius]UAT29543.1 hypothetical protein K7T73_13135 [Bacillus badius]
MDIQTIDAHAKSVMLAYKSGILSIHGNRVHLLGRIFDELLTETGSQFKVVDRDSEDYPFEVSFIHNGITYYAIYSLEEIKNKFGGNMDELITAN